MFQTGERASHTVARYLHLTMVGAAHHVIHVPITALNPENQGWFYGPPEEYGMFLSAADHYDLLIKSGVRCRSRHEIPGIDLKELFI